MVRPGKARVCDQPAEARPARVFDIAEERIQVADAIRENRQRIDTRVTQVLLGPELVSDEGTGRGERLIVDQSLGGMVGDLKSFDALVHGCLLK